jgi:hypothetical protein
MIVLQLVFISILMQWTQGLVVTKAVSIFMMSEQNIRAFCSAWMAWHRSRPVPEAQLAPEQGTFVQ